MKNEKPQIVAINILFDGPPGSEPGRFVDVVTDDNSQVNAGEWIERPDGYWALRITELPTASACSRLGRIA